MFQWNGLCCIFDDNNKTVNMIVNGELFQYNLTLSGISTTMGDPVIGSDQSKVKNYRGQITKFNILKTS